ncbi:ParA family protein [Alienimonas californiensis]|uniref:ParA family protein n=1 Tax=Alienimonas californiensis TaxID=2527989 RepID=UPI001F6106F7
MNFAAFCGSRGIRTLLVDLDPQANATLWCLSLEQLQQHAKECGTVADLLGQRRHTSAEGSAKTAQDVLRESVFPGVDLIPSHLGLYTADAELAGEAGREYLLTRALEPIRADYQMVVCDCPPSLNVATHNAIAIGTHFVTPVSLDFLSVFGVGLLYPKITGICEALGTTLENAGIVIGKAGRTSTHRDDARWALQERFKTLVLPHEITDRSIVSEAAEKHLPVFDMANAKATEEFTAVCSELLTRVGVTG